MPPTTATPKKFPFFVSLSIQPKASTQHQKHTFHIPNEGVRIHAPNEKKNHQILIESKYRRIQGYSCLQCTTQFIHVRKFIWLFVVGVVCCCLLWNVVSILILYEGERKMCVRKSFQMENGFEKPLFAAHASLSCSKCLSHRLSNIYGLGEWKRAPFLCSQSYGEKM